MERKSKDRIAQLEGTVARLEQKQQLSDALLLMLVHKTIDTHLNTSLLAAIEKALAPAAAPVEIKAPIDLRAEAREIILEMAQKMGLQSVNGFEKRY